MRTQRFDMVVLTAAALSDGDRLDDLATELARAKRHVEIMVVGGPLDPAWPAVIAGAWLPEGSERLTECYGAKKSILVFGADVGDLALAQHSDLCFFVGPEHCLRRSFRNVIPMWGQGTWGIVNALNYLSANGFELEILEHRDVVGFVDRSISFFARDDATLRGLARHQHFCDDLRDAFGDAVAGIFATGFPFYLSQSTLQDGSARTPPSIVAYLQQQRRYFASKLIDARTFEASSERSIDAGEALSELGVRVDRNAFDRYEYTSAGVRPPAVPTRATLEEFRASTAFDIASDPWPCALCVPLQAPDLFANQRITKDTNATCLRCNQTSLMLRNVSAAAVDLDVIVVVHGDRRTAATEIKKWVQDHSGSYLYDLDLRRMVMNENDGPVDLFVTGLQDVLDALGRVSTTSWLSTTFPAVALWSLTLEDHRFNLGEDLPLTFVPRVTMDPQLDAALSEARRRFAQAFSTEVVVEALRAHSSAHSQLLGNDTIVNALAERLAGWRDGPPHQES